MIKVYYGSEKTNSYRPVPWHWSEEPFPAFRGSGQRYTAFQAVAKGFTPWFNTEDLASNQAISDDTCKIITTKKGARLLVSCGKKEDERILLITARGGFRGGFGRILAVGGEILWRKGMGMHCTPVEHIIARITDPEGYVMTETGRRCSSGLVEVYSWKGGYFSMPTSEYEAAVETGSLFAAHDTIEQELEACRKLHEAEKASQAARAQFLPKIKAINVRREACGGPAIDLGDSTYFRRRLWNGWARFLYTEDAVAEAEEATAKLEADYALKLAHDEWAPRFREAAGTVEGLRYGAYSNVFSVDSDRQGHKSYAYSAEGLAEFEVDLPGYAEEIRQKAEAKAKAEVEAKARREAEEVARRAEEERKVRQAELEEQGRAAGLPSDVRIWHRVGATKAGQGWVIRPDGTDRECDDVDTSMLGSNTKRYHQHYEGDHIWRQICPGELVLQWRKAYTAAEHEFSVIYAPAEPTEAQLERVAEIQNGIEESWKGRTGLASGRMSPPIGQGWGLFPRKNSAFGIAPSVGIPEPVASSEADPVKEEGIDPFSPMVIAMKKAGLI